MNLLVSCNDVSLVSKFIGAVGDQNVFMKWKTRFKISYKFAFEITIAIINVYIVRDIFQKADRFMQYLCSSDMNNGSAMDS